MLTSLVDLGLALVRQLGLAELEVARVFAQDHFVDDRASPTLSTASAFARRRRPPSSASVALVSAATALPSAVEAAVLRALDAGLRLLIDFGDLRFVLLVRSCVSSSDCAERVDFAAHLADLVPHVALGRARGRAGRAERTMRLPSVICA